MAVYQGARPYPAILPRPRRAARNRTRSGGSGRVSLSLAGILVCFLLGLFYLTQMIHVATTGYDIDSLVVERNRLEQELQSLQGDIARWGAEPQILSDAQQAGLADLGNPVRLPAH
jgi:hypothetical protein